MKSAPDLSESMVQVVPVFERSIGENHRIAKADTSGQRQIVVFDPPIRHNAFVLVIPFLPTPLDANYFTPDNVKIHEVQYKDPIDINNPPTPPARTQCVELHVEKVAPLSLTGMPQAEAWAVFCTGRCSGVRP